MTPHRLLRRRMKIISENLALCDFLLASVRSRKYSDLERGRLEWPVWVGRITVSAYVTGSRLTHDARVILTSPIQRPNFIRGSGLVRQHRIPTGTFRCEPYNMVPLPPWGTLRPFDEDDARALKPVAQRLEETGHVGVPQPHGRTQPAEDALLDVRIFTKAQARRKLESSQMMMATTRAWMQRMVGVLREDGAGGDDAVEDDSSQLLCCWQDDSVEAVNDREYVSYILDLLNVHKRLMEDEHY